MTLQHLQPRDPHPANVPSRVIVRAKVSWVLSSCGVGVFFNLALTRVCPRLFDLLKLRQGLGSRDMFFLLGRPQVALQFPHIDIWGVLYDHENVKGVRGFGGGHDHLSA